MTTHKRGDTFDRIVTLPAFDAETNTGFEDGYFASGWTLAAQVRTHQPAAPNRPPLGTLVADLQVSWLDAVTTRNLRLLAIDTNAWPIGACEVDVQFTRTSDSYVISTSTAVFEVVRDTTTTE